MIEFSCKWSRTIPIELIVSIFHKWNLTTLKKIETINSIGIVLEIQTNGKMSLAIEKQPVLRTRSSKHDKCFRVERKVKHSESTYWKRAKSIAIHKQSRVENQFVESEPMIDEKWANWNAPCNLGRGWIDEPIKRIRNNNVWAKLYNIALIYKDGIFVETVPFNYEVETMA
jgi:hypothetical protein